MSLYKVHLESRGCFTIEAASKEDAKSSYEDGVYEETETQIIDVELVRSFNQDEVHNELIGLADSLDDHVTKEDVARELRALAAKIEDGAF